MKEVENYLMISVRNTFKDMANLEISTLSSDVKLDYTNVFTIDSSSPEELKLLFYFPLKLKKLLVERILCDSWEKISNQYIDDCLLEIVNIIGGNFFCRYYSPKRYEIGLPKLSFDDDNLSKGVKYFFKTEDIIFAIALS